MWLETEVNKTTNTFDRMQKWQDSIDKRIYLIVRDSFDEERIALENLSNSIKENESTFKMMCKMQNDIDNLTKSKSNKGEIDGVVENQ